MTENQPNSAGYPPSDTDLNHRWVEALPPFRTYEVTAPAEHSLPALLMLIPDPRRAAILRIVADYADLVDTIPASSGNHQNWAGGYSDHLADMLWLSWPSYGALDYLAQLRGETLPFTLGQAQVCIFAHDAEKLVRYNPDQSDPRTAPALVRPTPDSRSLTPTQSEIADAWEMTRHNLISSWSTLGLTLTDAETDALVYVHGEGSAYRKDRRVQSELSAFVGNLDRASARILHSSRP